MPARACSPFHVPLACPLRPSTCSSLPPILPLPTCLHRQLSMRINRGFTRWWDARNAFRGAGSAVVALCYQMPVWGVDPAIHVRLMCRLAC